MSNGVFPPSFNFSFTIPDGSVAMLQYQLISNMPVHYEIDLLHTEVDRTRYQLSYTFLAFISSVERVLPAIINLTNPIIKGITFLQVDGKIILRLSNIEQINVSQSFTYQSDVISVDNGNFTLSDIDSIYYADLFQFYQFNNSKILPVDGTGKLYYNPITSQVLYTNNNDLILMLDRIISEVYGKVYQTISQ